MPPHTIHQQLESITAAALDDEEWAEDVNKPSSLNKWSLVLIYLQSQTHMTPPLLTPPSGKIVN